jgi:hypothetical protein
MLLMPKRLEALTARAVPHRTIQPSLAVPKARAAAPAVQVAPAPVARDVWVGRASAPAPAVALKAPALAVGPTLPALAPNAAGPKQVHEQAAGRK